jgi:hypothetical protein
MVAGVFWTGLGPGTTLESIATGFGIVAAGLYGHGIRGLFDPWMHPSTWFAFLVLGTNFAAWSVALFMLSAGALA